MQWITGRIVRKAEPCNFQTGVDSSGFIALDRCPNEFYLIPLAVSTLELYQEIDKAKQCGDTITVLIKGDHFLKDFER